MPRGTFLPSCFEKAFVKRTCFPCSPESRGDSQSVGVSVFDCEPGWTVWVWKLTTATKQAEALARESGNNEAAVMYIEQTKQPVWDGEWGDTVVLSTCGVNIDRTLSCCFLFSLKKKRGKTQTDEITSCRMSYLAQTNVDSGFLQSDGGFAFLHEPREELLYVALQL